MVHASVSLKGIEVTGKRAKSTRHFLSYMGRFHRLAVEIPPSIRRTQDHFAGGHNKEPFILVQTTSMIILLALTACHVLLDILFFLSFSFSFSFLLFLSFFLTFMFFIFAQ